MFNNSGAYSPNEAPNTVVASLNRTESNSSKIAHNLASYSKIMQQVASATSENYEALNLPNFGLPHSSIPSQMFPFQAYPGLGHSSSYLPSNSSLSPDNALQDYFSPVSTQSTHSESNNMNFHQNLLMKSSTELQTAPFQEPSSMKHYPINIPQVPARIYQKYPDLSGNDYTPEVQTQTPEILHNLLSSSSLQTEIYHCSSKKNTYNEPILSSPAESPNTEITPEPANNNDEDSILNKNNESIIMTNNKAISEPELYINQSTPSPKSPLQNEDNRQNVKKTFISEKKRQSLEKTVRLIESILTKSTNNNKPDVTELPIKDPLAFSPKITSDNESDSDNEVLIKKVTKRKSKATHGKISCLNPKTETDMSEVDSNRPIKSEVHFIEVKIEKSSWPDMEYEFPFRNDSNGKSLNEIGNENIIDMATSEQEALDTVKNGKSTSAYFECPDCSILIKHPKRFLIHTKWHKFGLLNKKRADISKQREDIREKRAKIIEGLTATELTGVEVDIYPCKDCDKIFQTKSSLKTHRRKFHTTEETECRICLHPVFGLKELREHLKCHEDKEAGLHQCPHCPKRFKYRHSLAKHADTHLEKTHGCPECSKMFGSPLLVRMHMRTHERMARGTIYHCSFCGKGFYETYNLNVHERTHRNDKPFRCETCDSRFVTNSSLTRHIRVSHGGAKPFLCEVCKKCFATESIRDRHALRFHSDQKKFKHQCTECPKRYLKAKDLKKHIYKKHTREKAKQSDTEAEAEMEAIS